MLLSVLITVIGVITITSAKEVNRNFDPEIFNNKEWNDAKNYDIGDARVQDDEKDLTDPVSRIVQILINDNDNNFQCGGFIHNTSFVITTAYCALRSYRIVLFDKSGQDEPFDIKNIFIHKDYNDNTLENNIAVLSFCNSYTIEESNFDEISEGNNVAIAKFNNISRLEGTVQENNCSIAFGDTFRTTKEFCIIRSGQLNNDILGLGGTVLNGNSFSGIISYYCDVDTDYCKVYDSPIVSLKLTEYETFINDACNEIPECPEIN